MTDSTSTPPGQESRVEPTLLSYYRALLDRADELRTRHLRLETAAALAAIVAAVPVAPLTTLFSCLAAAFKVRSKWTLNRSRAAFRSGERMRRYHYQEGSLGWPTPPRERADFALLKRDADLADRAAVLAETEPDYFTVAGTGGPVRLYANLIESMFWTERLMGAVAKSRWKVVWLAILAPCSVLGLALLGPGTDLVLALKVVAACIAYLVAVDAYWEWSGFQRGEQQVRDLLAAAMADLKRPELSVEEGMRLLLEYNCALAELPQIPTRAHAENKDALDAAWKEFWGSLLQDTTNARRFGPPPATPTGGKIC